MSRKMLFTAVALSLSLCCAVRPVAAATSVASDPVEVMEKAGWKPVRTGVLQRTMGGNKVESLVFGVEGFTWKLAGLEAQMGILRSEFEAHPTGDLRLAIAAQRREIVSTKQLIQRLQVLGASTQADVFTDKVSCSINFGYNADAYPLTSSVGVGATASANFSSNCAFSGEVYAYGYSKATTSGGLVTTLTKTDGPRAGASVSASATGSVNGVTDCYSYAYSSMTSNSLSPSSYSVEDTNYSCPSAPPTVTVTSNYGSAVTIVGYDCATITWTANVSGGTAPVTTTMYKNSVSQGVRTTYSQTFCGNNVASTQTVTVAANVTDGAGQTASGSQTTTITFRRETVTTGCVSTSSAGLTACP